tara:strand:+ start:168 stop:749 length:582 start_codon:yes stop_codon:yes gene_type:complete
MRFLGKNFSFKLFVLFLFASSGYLFSTPYLSILSFKRAIDLQDSEAASKYVDFPSVRTSLKEQLRASFEYKNVGNQIDGRFLDIGTLIFDPFAERVIKSVLEYTVNPEGLALLLSTGKLSAGNSKVDKQIDKYQELDNDVIIKLHYIDINKFILISYLPTFDEPIKAYWKRESINHWNLHSIRLPAKTFRILN